MITRSRIPSLVSIVVYCCNHEEYIERSLESLQQQTYSSTEVIIVDDASQDRSVHLAQRWIDSLPRNTALHPVILRLPRQVGHSAAVTIGMFAAKGEFIAIQHADDFMLPQRIERQADFLRNHPDIGLVGTDYAVLKEGELRSSGGWLQFGEDIARCYSAGGHCICFYTIMLRGEVFDQIGGMTRALKGVEDYEWIARCATHQVAMENLPDVHYIYQKHAGKKTEPITVYPEEKVDLFPRVTGMVSVIITSYNRAEYLEESLNSLLQQTYRNIEIILVNDASTDNTLDIVKAWASRLEPRFPLERFVVMHAPRNLGYSGAISTGFFLARGEFIANQDSDDYSHPERLEKQVRYLHDNPGLDWVGTRFVSFRDNPYRESYKDFWLAFDVNQIKQNYVLGHHCVSHGTSLYRASVIDRLGGFNRSHLHEDFEFTLRCSRAGVQMGNIPEYLYYYRKHPGQMSLQKHGLR